MNNEGGTEASRARCDKSVGAFVDGVERTHTSSRAVDAVSDAHLDEFLRNACGCTHGKDNSPCISMIPKQIVREHLNNIRELTKSERDLVILAQINA